MSQLVKMKRQANFKGFKRFGVFKGLVEQKKTYLTRSCVNWAFFGTRRPLKRSFTRAKKGPIYTNSSNKLLLNGVTLDPTIKHQSQKTYEFKSMEYVLDNKLI
jgi:hypothetical protein